GVLAFIGFAFKFSSDFTECPIQALFWLRWDNRFSSSLPHLSSYLLSFDCFSINFFVSNTNPNICVHSDTIFPTTSPHRPCGFIFANAATQTAPVASRKMVSECSRICSSVRGKNSFGGSLLSLDPFS